MTKRRRLAFATIHINSNPLACRTGYTVMTTHRTLEAACEQNASHDNHDIHVAALLTTGDYLRLDHDGTDAQSIRRAYANLIAKGDVRANA